MTDADAGALESVQAVRRQLREITGVREIRPGTFQFRNAAFVTFRVEDGVLHAEMRKAGGSGFDRYAVATPPQQRKFVDDARLRVRRLEDE